MLRFALFLLGAALAPSAAAAHVVEGSASGFTSGFMHPISGPDHLLAMVAVGLWGAILGRPLIVALPVTFPMMMAVGALVGVAGVPLPGIEVGVALSAIALGAVVAAAYRMPVPGAVALVAVFALFHGQAHGAALPEAVSPVAYAVGFVTSTGLLHLAGIGIGFLFDMGETGRRVVQGFGLVIVLAGVFFLLSALGVF